MRYAIAAIPRRGGRQKASEVCSFVRDCKAGKLADVLDGNAMPCVDRGDGPDA